jgi:hypothetical protein
MNIFAIDRFDQNEWFIIIMLILTYLIAYLIPRRFPTSITVLLMIWAFTVSQLFDFTIGGGVFDYYDVNDSPRYCLMDLATYFLYAPFSYFFIYIYDVFQIKPRHLALYIIVCSIFAVGFETLMVVFKVITYKNDWYRFYSFDVYLFTQSLTILFYKWIRGEKQNPS